MHRDTRANTTLKKVKKLSFAKNIDGVQPDFFEVAEGLNKIKEIPDWISELVNLEFLNLSGNEIVIIPKNIGQLQKLKQLYLHDNEIMFVDHSLGELDNLEVLWIHSNNLYDFKYQLEALVELDKEEGHDKFRNHLLLHNNMLKVITENIIQLKKLRNLWFDCRISPNGPIESRPGGWQKFFTLTLSQTHVITHYH